ncbi:hypothetical protein BGE01nite_54960 [Brevifollis gellanilyticus]|uniref:DUF4034 domain-containing protein n=2 Tax=Brevifollis gellanilyticus TaxID=748831 RepID=A0A512MHI7_9BACT|nr:hypothetical protein BGE01nite_54960 [Brevifollis gellanilyticus]
MWGQLQLRSPDHVTQMKQRESLPAEARQEHDDNQKAAHYWYESRNPKNLPEIDAALARVLPNALRQSAWISEVPSWEEAHRVQAYHDAGAILLARCYTLLYYGRENEAKESIKLINDKFPHALLLRPDRRVILVRRSLRYHMHACAIYRAIRERKMYDFEFPPEMDEHDAWAQERAAEDMAMLRLREGDFDGLDHLASQARLRALKTADGEWVSDAIYSGIHPLEGESWSAAAWDEMGGRLDEWREKKPTSVDARIANVIFTLYRFKGEVELAGSTKEALLKLRRTVEEIGPVSPQMPFIEMIVSIALEERLDQIASIYQKAQKKFPDYTPTHMFMLMRLAAEENGERHCRSMLRELASHEETVEQAARILTCLPEKSVMVLTEGLPLKDLRESMRALLESAPGSSHLRNRLGLLAVFVGQDDIGMEAMRTVGGRWERKLWSGREYHATRLTERQPIQASVPAKVGEL